MIALLSSVGSTLINYPWKQLSNLVRLSPIRIALVRLLTGLSMLLYDGKRLKQDRKGPKRGMNLERTIPHTLARQMCFIAPPTCF